VFASCCHSNATRAPVANPPSSAQLGGIPYHSSKLHPGPCNSVGMRQWTDRQTHRRGWLTTIHFASSTTHAKCNEQVKWRCYISWCGMMRRWSTWNQRLREREREREAADNIDEQLSINKSRCRHPTISVLFTVICACVGVNTVLAPTTYRPVCSDGQPRWYDVTVAFGTAMYQFYQPLYRLRCGTMLSRCGQESRLWTLETERERERERGREVEVKE